MFIPRRFVRRLPFALRGLWMAVAICAVLIGYPVYLEVAGPATIHGSNHGTYPFGSDTLDMVVPNHDQLLAPRVGWPSATVSINGYTVENGSYLRPCWSC